MLWDDFGVRDVAALALRIIAYTLGSEYLPTEILNNSVRITLAATGAVLGGVQTLFCSSIDEALGLPTDAHALLSIRTQQVLLKESGLADYVDVLGGGEVIERLTSRYCKEAKAIAANIEERGGATAVITSGWMRSEIDQDAWKTHLEAAERVGVTPESGADVDVDVFSIPRENEVERREEFVRWRDRRDAVAVRTALSRVEAAVAQRENLVPSLTEAFLADATLGETCRILTERFGSAIGRAC